MNRKALKPENKTSANGPMPVKSTYKDKVESQAMKFEKEAIGAELAGNYEVAAEAYQKAAEFEFDREQKSNFFLLCAECWMTVRNNSKTYMACNSAIGVAWPKDKGAVREKAIRIMHKGAETIIANADYMCVAGTYGLISTLEEDREKKIEYLMLSIENFAKAGKYGGCAQQYEFVIDLENDKAKKKEYLLTAAELYAKCMNERKTNNMYEKAVEIAEGEEKDRIRRIAVRSLVGIADKQNEENKAGKAVAYGFAAEFEIDREKKIKYYTIAAEKHLEDKGHVGYAKACHNIAELEEDREKKIKYLMLAGENYAKTSHYDIAQNVYKKAIELAEGEEKRKIGQITVRALTEGGDKYLEEKDYVRAGLAYRSAAEHEEDIENKIGYLLLYGKDPANAEEVYEKAAELVGQGESHIIRQTAIRALNKGAEKYLEKKNYAGAAAAYRNAAELEEDTENKIGYFLLIGENLIKAKSYDRAGDAYLNAMELSGEEKRNKIQETALEMLLSCAEKELERNNPWTAASAYRNAAKFTDDIKKKSEYLTLAGDNYLKGKNYEDCTKLYSRAAELAHEIGDKEKVVQLLRKIFEPSIEEGVRSEVLERLAVKYNMEEDYARLFMYNVKTNGNVPGVNERIREVIGINKKDLEYLKETIRYLPARIMSEINIAELLSSNPKEFYALARLGVIPFDDLIQYFKENRNEVENRALKKTDFDSSNPLHVAVEYGRYVGKVRSMSPVSKEAEVFLTYGEFKEEIDKPSEKIELDETEIKYLAYEISESAKVLKQLIENFGGIVLVGNLRTGEYYADLMVRQLKDKRLFHSIARMPSSVLHEREYFLKGELLDKVTVKNITSVNAKPVVVVDATIALVKISDGFKGYMSWATGYNILLLKARGADREQIIEQVSDLALTERGVVNSIYDDVTNTQSSFYKRIWPWVKLNPGRKRLVRVSIMDMDGVYSYRIKKNYAYFLPPRKGIDEDSTDEDTVPMILLQPSKCIRNIPAIVQERIGSSNHKKGYLDDNTLGRLMLRADKDGVSIVTNIVEVISEKISEMEN